MDYEVRIPTMEEWRQLANAVNCRNEKMHWRGIYSWVTNTYDDAERKSVAGYHSTSGTNLFQYHFRANHVGFRPVFVPMDEDVSPDGIEIVMGTLFMDGDPVRVAKSPVDVGDITPYTPDAKLEFRDPLLQKEYQVKAIKVNGIYFADRCLLNHISWTDLYKQGLCGNQKPKRTEKQPLLRLVRPRMVTLDAYTDSLQLGLQMHWDKMYSWLGDEAGARCGYVDPRYLAEGASDVRSEAVGFRPMFEATRDVPRGGIVTTTLYLDGKPAKVPKLPTRGGDIPEYRAGTKIEFRGPLKNTDFQIWAVSIGKYLVADRCVLRNISWDDLDALGF